MKLRKRSKIIFLTAAVVYLIGAVLLLKTGYEKMHSGEADISADGAQKEDMDQINRVDSNSILGMYNLPMLERMQEDERQEYVEGLQVILKLDQIGIDKDYYLYPERNLQDLYVKLAEQEFDPADFAETVDFAGETSAELQTVIDENPGALIQISSDRIIVSEAVILRDNTFLCGNGVRMESSGVQHVFVGNEISNVLIKGFFVDGGADYGVFLVDSGNVEVSDCIFSQLSQKPICIIGESEKIRICNNDMYSNAAGGVYISGDVSCGLIEGNKITDNGGTSNWMAGIVLTNVVSEDPMDIWETFDANHHFPYKENLYSQTKCPHDFIVQGNQVSFNNASGIYSDGAYSCFVINNDVQGNDKEGICLDYGTIGFYLTENLFSGNGQRLRQTDKDLEMDFVLGAGRMEDGSAKAKLPGISLDNTAYNILENNTVINNYGGGIKMVRTTVRNLIIENIVKNNNEGENDIYHFFGIELGSAIADVESKDMDFTPDYENIICRNTISGNHYSGIFVGADCYVNDIFDNVIMQPEAFAVEAISNKFNSIVNNLSDRDIRNEYQQ